jgi:hypothetical protein
VASYFSTRDGSHEWVVPDVLRSLADHHHVGHTRICAHRSHRPDALPYPCISHTNKVWALEGQGVEVEEGQRLKHGNPHQKMKCLNPMKNFRMTTSVKGYMLVLRTQY